MTTHIILIILFTYKLLCITTFVFRGKRNKKRWEIQVFEPSVLTLFNATDVYYKTKNNWLKTSCAAETLVKCFPQNIFILFRLSSIKIQ